ncbi:MAG: polyphosphate kinase 1 [Deltaproteobacteria bacterium]|nr:polyphosphate kinase 1 [Deltaproteobacteria bacterium]
MTTVLKDESRFFNREWSWLRFNERVLEEAEDESNPLLERLKFVSIFCSNLDEFFMVRVAGLHRQVDAKIRSSGIDSRPPREQIDGIHQQVHELVQRQERVLQQIFSELRGQGIAVMGMEELDGGERAYAERYYEELIYPVLTPMIVGPKHPFPKLQNLTLYLVLQLRDRRKGRRVRRGDEGSSSHRIGFVALPKVLPRFLRVGAGDRCGLVPLESILVIKMAQLFAGYDVLSVNAVRVTRDADIALDEEATDDMRRAMAKKLLGRRHGAAVRIEHGSRLASRVQQTLHKELEGAPRFPHEGLMQPVDLMQIYASVDRPGLKDQPVESVNLRRDHADSIFDWMRRSPRLVHHPYHTFDPVAELVTEAARDPKVLAIKQTLYRTSGNSPVIRALTTAAEAGKSVTVVVELRARFDEERNIEWAERLEKAGAHVVYGLVGFKTHSKALLVVRRDPDGIRRYIHLGTGNYNDATARIYTDMGLFTVEELVGEDVSALFNVITGATQPPPWNKVEMSPTGLRGKFLQLIRLEIAKSARRSPGHIIAKMNSLVDREVIDALYEASRAGVRVDLIVRGTCCLRPGVPGLSENICVRSIVGRYLEHTRAFWFKGGGQEELYLSSADWMSRNLDRRIELMFPIEDPTHRAYVKAVLDLQLADTVKARELLQDGRYKRVEGRHRVDSQAETHRFTAASQAEAKPSIPERFIPLASSARSRHEV